MAERIKRGWAALRGWNHKRILSLCFVAYVFAVGSATFPQSLTSLGEALQRTPVTMQKITQPLDGLYRGMLDFKSSTLVNKGSYINLNGLIARLMGQRYMNRMIKLDNGHLTVAVERMDIAEACGQVTELHEKQRAAGKAFLFVLAPEQTPKYESLMPAGYESYANENGDALLAALRENGVPVLDLREEMFKEGLRHQDMFFASDHHWTPEASFWAYAKIMENLALRGVVPAMDPMYTDLSNYQVDVYPRWLLGSGGKRTGKYYTEVDDFSVITPRFETHMVTEIISKDEKREGSFAEVALDWERVRKRDYFIESPFSLYGFNNPDRMRYQNDQAPISQKALWLGDSFGSAVTPLISLAFRTVEDLDMRYYSEDYAAFYDEYQPDVIVMLITTRSPVQVNTTYDFFPDVSPGP